MLVKRSTNVTVWFLEKGDYFYFQKELNSLINEFSFILKNENLQDYVDYCAKGIFYL
jgi:hypothetical protein